MPLRTLRPLDDLENQTFGCPGTLIYITTLSLSSPWLIFSKLLIFGNHKIDSFGFAPHLYPLINASYWNRHLLPNSPIWCTSLRRTILLHTIRPSQSVPRISHSVTRCTYWSDLGVLSTDSNYPNNEDKLVTPLPPFFPTILNGFGDIRISSVNRTSPPPVKRVSLVSILPSLYSNTEHRRWSTHWNPLCGVSRFGDTRIDSIPPPYHRLNVHLPIYSIKYTLCRVTDRVPVVSSLYNSRPFMSKSFLPTVFSVTNFNPKKNRSNIYERSHYS